MAGRIISTSHGRVMVKDRGGAGRPMLLLHGNSTSRQVFARQMDGALNETCRLIAFDLPGHGQSADALDPQRSYTLAGLADVATEVLEALGIGRVILLGWSLGGHIAIEMLNRRAGIEGLVLTGTPPIRRGCYADGFVPSPAFALAGSLSLTLAEAEEFGRAILGDVLDPRFLSSIVRADGCCRQRVFESGYAGEGCDQRETVEASQIPVAVINGADDPLINLDYIDGVDFPALWSGRCHRIEGGHAAFREAAPAFNRLVADFVDDLAKQFPLETR